MDKKYIDAEALKKDLIKRGFYPAMVKNAIEHAPAADVAEVVHGEWIVKTDYKTPLSHGYIRKEKLHICPCCAKAYRQKMNFCGNCGAKMDGGKHETD